MANKYKAGDIIHVRLGDHTAKYLNKKWSPYIYEEDIIAHHPATMITDKMRQRAKKDMKKNHDIIDITCTIKHTTEKAVLINDGTTDI